METTVTHVNKEQFDVYIGRPMPRRGLRGSIWANPYKIGSKVEGRALSREDVITLYEGLVRWRLFGPNGDWWRRELEQLRGRRLGCWCYPKPCHGNVLVKLLAELKAISVESVGSSLSTILTRCPGAFIIDVTLQAPPPWCRFSPMYPHGDIPIPFSPGYTGQTVEGIWQGLKAFDKADMNQAKFSTTTGLNLSSYQYGPESGYRAGVDSDVLLSRYQARIKILLPTYKWVLDNHLQAEVAVLREIIEQQRRPVVLLDRTTNIDIEDLATPLSPAGLVALYVQGKWPENQFSHMFRAGEVVEAGTEL